MFKALIIVVVVFVFCWDYCRGDTTNYQNLSMVWSLGDITLGKKLIRWMLFETRQAIMVNVFRFNLTNVAFQNCSYQKITLKAFTLIKFI